MHAQIPLIRADPGSPRHQRLRKMEGDQTERGFWASGDTFKLWGHLGTLRTPGDTNRWHMRTIRMPYQTKLLITDSFTRPISLLFQEVHRYIFWLWMEELRYVLNIWLHEFFVAYGWILTAQRIISWPYQNNMLTEIALCIPTRPTQH